MHVVQNESLLFLFVKQFLVSYEVIKKGLPFSPEFLVETQRMRNLQ